MQSITTPESAKLVGKLMPYTEHLHAGAACAFKQNTTDRKALTLTGNAQALMNIFCLNRGELMWIRQASTAEQLLAQEQASDKQNFTMQALLTNTLSTGSCQRFSVILTY